MVDVSGVIAAWLPGYRVDSVGPAGDGLDNVAYEVNGELIVRFHKDPDPDRLDREVRLLAAVAAVSPLPVPVPRFADAARGCMAYDKLPGTPLLEVPPPARSGRPASMALMAAQLGGFLGALHGVPVAVVGELVDTDDQPPSQRLAEAAGLYPSVAGHIPAAHRRSVESFLDTPPPGAGPVLVFAHNDLGIEHVLVDPVGWTVTGIIDWSDAAIVDPAYDFGLLYRDLGPAALDAALGSYRTNSHDLTPLRDRAVFYGRCSVLEDLAYAIESGRTRYLDSAVAAMAWLFA